MGQKKKRKTSRKQNTETSSPTLSIGRQRPLEDRQSERAGNSVARHRFSARKGAPGPIFDAGPIRASRPAFGVPFASGRPVEETGPLGAHSARIRVLRGPGIPPVPCRRVFSTGGSAAVDVSSGPIASGLASRRAGAGHRGSARRGWKKAVAAALGDGRYYCKRKSGSPSRRGSDQGRRLRRGLSRPSSGRRSRTRAGLKGPSAGSAFRRSSRRGTGGHSGAEGQPVGGGLRLRRRQRRLGGAKARDGRFFVGWGRPPIYLLRHCRELDPPVGRAAAPRLGGEFFRRMPRTRLPSDAARTGSRARRYRRQELSPPTLGAAISRRKGLSRPAGDAGRAATQGDRPTAGKRPSAHRVRRARAPWPDPPGRVGAGRVRQDLSGKLGERPGKRREELALAHAAPPSTGAMRAGTAV